LFCPIFSGMGLGINVGAKERVRSTNSELLVLTKSVLSGGESE